MWLCVTHMEVGVKQVAEVLHSILSLGQHAVAGRLAATLVDSGHLGVLIQALVHSSNQVLLQAGQALQQSPSAQECCGRLPARIHVLKHVKEGRPRGACQRMERAFLACRGMQMLWPLFCWRCWPRAPALP